MKLCSECKEPLEGHLAFTEEGQEDYPWCQKCVDYVDALYLHESQVNDAEIRGAEPAFGGAPIIHEQMSLFEELD